MSEQNEGMSLGDLHDWGLTLVEQPFTRWLSATDGDFKILTNYDQIPEEETKKGAGILDSEIVNVNLEGTTLLDRDVRDSRSAVLTLADSVKGESRQELLKYAEEIAHKNETFFYWLRGQITQSDTSGRSPAGATIGWFGFSRTIIKKDNPVGIEGAVLDKRRGTDVVTLNPEGKEWINLPERCVGAITLLTLET